MKISLSMRTLLCVSPTEFPLCWSGNSVGESTAYSIVLLLGSTSILMRVLIFCVIVYVSCVCVKGGGVMRL